MYVDSSLQFPSQSLEATDDKVCVFIFDDFGYSSAIRDDVIFYDYSADFEAGWDAYNLDSLNELSDFQAFFYPGTGAYRVEDDLPGDGYETFIDFNGSTKGTDYNVDPVDDDNDWDYFWYSWDEATGGWIEYFTNDLDDLHEIPNSPEAEALGLFLPHYRPFEDLDGAVDFYDTLGIDGYYKLDEDPNFDYSFYVWTEDIIPIEGTEAFTLLSKSEIEEKKNEDNFSNQFNHGDIVLNNFFAALDKEYKDQVTVIAVDGWDRYSDGSYVWADDFLFSNIDEFFLQLEEETGFSRNDIDVTSLSFGNGDIGASHLLNQIASDFPVYITKALPNDGKYADRYWDAFIEEQLQIEKDLIHVGGSEELFRGYPASLAYEEVSALAVDVVHQEGFGTSFATPKIAGELVNLKLDLDASGHSIESLSQDRIVEYLRGELTIVELTYPNLTHIVVSDEVVELGSALDDGSFDVAEWSGVIGNSLSENIHAVLNNQNIAAADRWSAAEIDIADLISEGLSTLQSNATLQSEVLEV